MPAVERSSSQQHLQQAQQLVQQQLQAQLQGTLGRTGLPWQQPPSLHHQPQTTAAAVLGPSIRPPPPVKPRQVSLSIFASLPRYQFIIKRILTLNSMNKR